MKTVRTLARALAVAVAVAAAPADADMPGISAPLETFRSPSGGFTLEVLAMDAPANKGVVVDRVQCLLTCEEEDHDGIPEAAIVLRLRGPDGKVRWTTGVDFGPSQATVANDGKHVALFNAASILEELDLPVAVVLFGEDGTLLKGFRLGDLLDRKTITRDLTRSVGSIHWYGYVGKVGHRFLEDGSALELHVAAKVPPPMYPQPPPRIVRILLPSLRVDPAVIVEPPGTPEELVRRFAAASDDAHRERILAMLLEARSPALGAFWVSLARDPAREALLDYALDGLHARGSEDLRSLLPLLGRSTNFDTRLLRALCWREDLRADPEALLARMRDPKATAEVRRLALHAAMQLSGSSAAVIGEGMRSSEASLRSAAAGHLERSPAKDCFAGLLSLLEDPDPEVRAAAEGSLMGGYLERPDPEGAAYAAQLEVEAAGEGSAVSRSARLLLALGRRRDALGHLGLAEAFYQRVVVLAERAMPQDPRHVPRIANAATARLGYLAAISGRAVEARRHAAALRARPKDLVTPAPGRVALWTLELAALIESLASSPLSLSAVPAAGGVTVTARNTGKARLVLTGVVIDGVRTRGASRCGEGPGKNPELEVGNLRLAPGASREWLFLVKPCSEPKDESGPTQVDLRIAGKGSAARVEQRAVVIVPAPP